MKLLKRATWKMSSGDDNRRVRYEMYEEDNVVAELHFLLA
jgi:hypothetical protein